MLPVSHAPKGGSETLIRCFTSKTGILDEMLLLSFFALKLSNEPLTLRPMRT